MAKEQSKTEAANGVEKILDFIQRSRVGLLICLGCIVLGIIVFIVGYSINESINKAAVIELDSYTEKLAGADFDSPETAELMAELEKFAKGKGGYAGAQAYNLVANYHAEKKEWDLAEKAWVNSANKAPGIFLAPLSMFNAAVAAEEQGNNIKAIDYYTQAAEYNGFFAGVTRAYFAIGRLYETQNDPAAAIEMYQKVVDDYPKDEWSKLAQSKLIDLSN